MYPISSEFDDTIGYIDDKGTIYNHLHEPLLLVDDEGAIRTPDGERKLYFDDGWNVYLNDGERLGYIDDNNRVYTNGDFFICELDDGRFRDPEGETILKIGTDDQTVWRKFAAAFSFDVIPLFE